MRDRVVLLHVLILPSFASSSSAALGDIFAFRRRLSRISSRISLPAKPTAQSPSPSQKDGRAKASQRKVWAEGEER